MRERLREVADQTAELCVVLLGEQTEIVGAGAHLAEQLLGGGEVADLDARGR